MIYIQPETRIPNWYSCLRYNLQPFYAYIFIFTLNLYDVTKTVKIKTKCTHERLK